MKNDLSRTFSKAIGQKSTKRKHAFQDVEWHFNKNENEFMKNKKP